MKKALKVLIKETFVCGALGLIIYEVHDMKLGILDTKAGILPVALMGCLKLSAINVSHVKNLMN